MTLVTVPNRLLSSSYPYHVSCLCNTFLSKGVCFLNYTILAVKFELNHFLMQIEDWFLMTYIVDTCM